MATLSKDLSTESDKMTHSINLTTLITILLLLPFSTQAQQQTLGDYRVSTYLNPYTEQAEQFEAFTKQPKSDAFFGLGCTNGSAMPVLQLVLLNKDVLIEAMRLTNVDIKIDKQATNIPLQGILKFTDSFEEHSNKVRLELATSGKQLKTLQNMQGQYKALLDKMQNGKSMQLTISHSSFGTHDYNFSLQGINLIMKDYGDLCF